MFLRAQVLPFSIVIYNRRFVFDIVARNLFGGPAVVALGLGYEPDLDTKVPLEEWPLLERLEPGIWLFEVAEENPVR